MTFSGRSAAACLLTAVAVAAGVAGCGSDNKAACDTVKSELSKVGTAALSKVGDLKGAQAEYAAAAGRIRQAAKGSGIEDAANRIATSLESLSASLTSGKPNLDQSSIIQAGIELKAACA